MSFSNRIKWGSNYRSFFIPMEKPIGENIQSENQSLETKPNTVITSAEEIPGKISIGLRGYPNQAGNQLDKPEYTEGYRKKNIVGEGSINLALFSANANQLRYTLNNEAGTSHYYTTFALILSSLVLQTVCAVLLAMSVRYSTTGREGRKFNDLLVIGFTLVTIINIIISSIGDVPSVDHAGI